MSEDRLFKQSDEQEAVYAPQQLPDGTSAAHAAHVDDGRGQGAGAVDSTIPAVALAGGANTGGLGPSVSTTGTASGVAPAAGLAGLTDAADDDR